jgi:peptidoglycan/LPS O-acetylase OafA/YrhL
VAARRFQAGDPLRGLAALAVLIFHGAIYARGRENPRLDPLDAYGETMAGLVGRLNQGVLLFFVLSGYLISRPFIRALLEGRRPPEMPRYLRNRLLRIVPLFWFFVAIGVARHGLEGADTGEMLAIVGFVQVLNPSPLADEVFGHAWSLDAEMAFYLAVPIMSLAMAAVLPRRGRTAVLVGACLVVAAVSITLRHRAEPGQEFPWLLMAPFVPGVLLAVVELRWAERLRGAGWAPPAALALVVLGLLGTGGALLVEWARGHSWRALDNPVLRWMGARGYGIYLFHVLVMLDVAALSARVDGGFARLGVMLAVSLPLTLLLADLGHRFVERPALRLRGRPELPQAAAPRRLSA